MKLKEKLGKLPIPGWLYTILLVVYCETLLHFWICEEFSAARFAAILAFALGFGGVLAQLVSFIGHKRWGKWVTVAVTFLVAAFYLVEFFVSESFMSFMPVGTLLGGAKGVATDFADVVVQVVLSGLWRILVIILPVLLYALLAAPVRTSWKLRWFGLVLAIAGYVVGLQVVNITGVDAARLSDSYNFDSAIRVFGLNMGMTLDVMRSGSEGEQGGDFIVMETPAPVETPEVPEEALPRETEPIVYEDNVMDFDFAALAENEKSGRIAKIHQYVNSVQPTKKNEFTGLFKGKNLIIITAEAFAKEAIDP